MNTAVVPGRGPEPLEGHRPQPVPGPVAPPAPLSRRLRRGITAGKLGLAATALSLLAFADRPVAALGLPSLPGIAVDASCQGVATLSFSPGLTLNPRTVEFQGNGLLFPCASTKVSRGTFSGSGFGVLSCTGGTAQATLDIDWLTRSGASASSRVEFALALAVGPNGGASLALEGTVTDGLFSGDRYRSTFQSVGVDTQNCLSPDGATSTVGTGTAVFEHGLLGL